MKELTMQNDCIITEAEKENLLHNISELLDEYDYSYERFAIKSIINEWASQKEELIIAFKTHPNYVEGKFMIAFNSDYERTFDKKAVTKFSGWITSIVSSYSDDIPDCIKERKGEAPYLPHNIWRFFYHLDAYIVGRTISKELTEHLETIIPEINPHIGEKTSRVINRLCAYLGYNKHPAYNREYAKFADGLNPLTIKRHTVLSINPLDYLTMSFGNSWASCHTIDKDNKRGMPSHYSGCYSSGTISYMLDGSSMVLYTVDAKYDEEDYWTQPKINRQMFHWGAEKLVQSRLYPQDNDDNKDAYAPYRNIVQQIISTIFDFPNLWTLSRGVEAASKYIRSEGTHYRDYDNFENCTLSKKRGSTNEECFVVGHAPICVECGEEHSNNENINCCSDRHVCAQCGCIIEDEDDVYWVNDDAYCGECVSYCDICNDYVRNDDTTYIPSEQRSVCDHCLERYYRYCDECEEYHDADEVRYLEHLGIDVCDDCLERYYVLCDKCDEYYRDEDVTHIDHLNIDVCDDCLETHYTICDECGEYFLNCEIHYDDKDNALCDECYDKENEEEC